MKTRLLSSFRSRLIAVVLLSALPALGTILWTSHQQKGAAAERVRKDVLGLAKLTAGTPNGLLEGGHQLLTALARLDEVQARRTAGCTEILRDLLGRYPIYNNLGVADESGRVFCSAIPVAGSVNAAETSWFRAAQETGGFVVGEYQAGGVSKKPALIFGYPFWGAGGAFRGVVFAAFDLGWLQRFTSEVVLPEGATLTVTDVSGVVLARKPEAGQFIGKRLQDAPLSVPPAAGTERVGEGRGIDGVPRLYASIPLTAGGGTVRNCMVVRVGIPLETAFADVNRERTRNLLLLGFVVFLILFTAWVASEAFILRNLRVLSSVTRRLSSGDMTARAGATVRVWEFQEVARAFDEMAESLDRQFRERERAEAELRESEERYRSVFQNSIDGILLMEPGKRVQAANEAACRMLGRSEKEILAARREDLFETSDPRLEEFIERRAKSGAALAEVVCKRPDGSAFACEVSSGLFLARNGGRLASLALRDITERLAMEERLRYADQMRLLGRITAGVAHEVRNPLNAILSVTEALFLELGPNPDYQPYLGHIRTQVERLSRLMRDLLDLGKPIQPSSLQPEFLVEMCRSTLQMWKEAVPDRKGEFEFRAPEELEDLRVETDIHRFQQILINLLENAVAHSPEPCRVSVEVASTEDGEARVLVRDQGPGIPGENLNRIFEPFFTTRRGGTGLGLSLVKHFVDSMKGKVAVRNNTPLPGCTVEILFPIAGDARS